MGEKDGQDVALLSWSRRLVQEGRRSLLFLNSRWRKVSARPGSGGIGREGTVPGSQGWAGLRLGEAVGVAGAGDRLWGGLDVDGLRET